MRTVISLVVLGLTGGLLPTGLAEFAHVAQVLAGTVGALLSLAVCCVAGAVSSGQPGVRPDVGLDSRERFTR